MNANLPLSLSLAGVREGIAGPREAIAWVAAQGFRAIQLDAMMPGLRPRELDRSARRGVASVLRRSGLALSGLDLWIPPEHFLDAARQQRAIDAVIAAVGLAVDLRDGTDPIVCITLPDGAAAAAVEIRRVAAQQGVTIADFGPVEVRVGDPIGAGFDPAAALAGKLSVAAEVARLGSAIVSARLSDWSGSRRVCPGQGRLDILEYGVSLSVAGYSRAVVVDLRDVDGASGAATLAREAWLGTSSSS